MRQWISERLKEPSTKKGIALIAAGATLAIGRPDIITASVTDAGIQFGGLVGAVVPFMVGIWEAIRREDLND